MTIQRDHRRRRIGQGLVLAAIVCGVSGATMSAFAEGFVRVPPDQVRSLMSGTTIETESKNGNTMHWTFRPDGRMDGELDMSISVYRDEGKWWVTNIGTFCFHWTKWSKAKQRCPLLGLEGEVIHLLRPSDGTPWKNRRTLRITSRGPGTERAMAAVLSGRAPQQVARARGALARTPVPLPEKRPVPPRPAVMQSPAVALDKTPPEIEAPASLSTDSAIVSFDGRVRDSSQILEVTVDGRPLPVRQDGSFTVRRGVRRGNSTIVLAVTDEWGNVARRSIAVTRASKTAQRPPVSTAAAVASPAQAKADPFAGLHFGKFHALVIGNDKYKSFNNLKTAVADAEAVGEELRRDYGFEVSVMKNGSRTQVLGALAKMRATLTANDSLLIYYAGHGIVDNIAEQGYWLPVDAQQDNPANWISTNDITSMLRAIRAKHILVVADSCYSGTLVRAVTAKLKTAHERRAWVERVLGKRARTALVSGGMEPVMDGGGGGHSVFAKAFLNALASNQGVMEGEALFDFIKRPVVLNSDQTPQYSDIRKSGHEGGDFLFVRRRN